MKKNLFLFPALVLTAFLCFITAACSSGYEEKGEVSFTFTEPMLRQISRSARAGDTDYSNLYPGFDFSGSAGNLFTNDNILMSYAGTSEDVEDTFILLVYKDGNFSVYSNELMSKASENNPFMQGGDDDENDSSGLPSYFYDPAYQEFSKNPYSIFDDALVSKGTWTQSGDNITITETHYRDASREELMPVDKASPVTISLSASTFTIDSKAGYKIQFYKTSANSPDGNIPDLDDDSDDENEDDLPDHPSELPDNKGENDSETDDLEDIKIKVELKVDGKSYYKEINEKGRISPDWKTTVEFKNIKAGATAQVLADVYISDEVHIEGKSDSFVISQGKNNVSVVMKYKILPHDGHDNPDDKPHNPDKPEVVETKTLYSATGVVPESYKEARQIFNGLLYFYVYDDYTYEIVGDTYDQNIQPLGQKLFAKGSWKYTDDDKDGLTLTETNYFDFEKNTIINGADGLLYVDLTKLAFYYNGWSAVEIYFKTSDYIDPDSQNEEELVSPGGTITAVYDGIDEKEKKSYKLLIFNNTEYAIYKVVIGDSGITQTQGAPICFGTCSFSEAEDKTFSIIYQEKAYLANEQYKASKQYGDSNSSSEIYISSESGLSFVFYINENENEHEKEPDIELPGSGSFTSDNRAVLISLNYNSEALYLNQGEFTFSAKYADGSALSEKDAEDIVWDADLLYRGKNINQIGNEGPYYEVSGNKLLLEKHIPLPSEGQYQIYVTAQLPVNENIVAPVTSSQTFNVYVPDRHIYDISDKYKDIRYAQSLHNVVITGDVTEDDWNWELTDESSNHILQNIFANHRNTLESLTFNGSFVSPDYTDASVSPLYNESSGIKFGRRVALIFNGTAKVGDYLFYNARNIKSITFTTDHSSIGNECFRNVSTLSNLDLTGVTTIGSYAFAVTGLKEITIPESVTLIDEGAFNDCDLSSAVFEITDGWKYVMNDDPYPANVSSEYALSTLTDPNTTKLFRE